MRIDLDRFLSIGHMGAAALAPPNSVPAILTAISLGVDVVEFDVRMARCGTLVLAHDDDGRPDASHGPTESLAALSLAEIQRRRWRRGVRPLDTLADGLAAIADHDGVCVNVDLKETGGERAVADHLRAAGLASRALASGHDHASLARLKRAEPRVATGVSLPDPGLLAGLAARRPWVHRFEGPPCALMRRRLPRMGVRLADRFGVDALMLHHRVISPEAVARLRDAGVPVLAWTVDDAARIAWLRSIGVAGVASNDPRLFAASLDPGTPSREIVPAAH